jgi:hypothetical protein
MTKRKGFGGIGHGLFEVVTQNFHGGTEGNHEKPQSGKQVSLPRFETSNSQILLKSVTAKPICSVIWTLIKQA